MSDSPIPFLIDKNKILQHLGWKIECESPYEIRHVDGSFATLNAAHIVESHVILEYMKNIKPEDLRVLLPPMQFSAD
jgi:hypothetical protein